MVPRVYRIRVQLYDTHQSKHCDCRYDHGKKQRTDHTVVRIEHDQQHDERDRNDKGSRGKKGNLFAVSLECIIITIDLYNFRFETVKLVDYYSRRLVWTEGGYFIYTVTH